MIDSLSTGSVNPGTCDLDLCPSLFDGLPGNVWLDLGCDKLILKRGDSSAYLEGNSGEACSQKAFAWYNSSGEFSSELQPSPFE